MKSKSRLDISKLTAEKLNLEQDVVDDVARAFYAYANKELASLEHTHINIPGLGTLWVRKNKVLDMIAKQEKVIAMLDHKAKLSLSRYSTLHEAKEKLDKLHLLLEKVEKEIERKKSYKR
jgi:uncharacterized protein YijF (DUF1287 family)